MKNNKLILIRGTSGSGKTTFALFLETLGLKAVAADDYFSLSGEYKFNEDELGKAHNYCYDICKEYLLKGESVVVHNTNVTSLEVNYYKNLAEELGVQFVSLIVENRSNTKNIHNVSNEKLERQALTLLNNISVLPDLKYNALKSKEWSKDKIHVLEYLKSFSSLDEGLKSLEDNYKIHHKKLNGKVLLKYDQFSEKTHQYSKESRGLIFYEDTLEVASLPFEKFYNLGEKEAPENLEIFKVYSKEDGTCLHEDTLIKTINGSKTIKEICENELFEELFSYNTETNKIEKDEIVAHSIKNNVNNWYEIELENGEKIKCTDDHLFYLPKLNCYKKAKDLTNEDEVLFIQN